jgi:PAS domain S-box-containing protein
MLLVDRATNKIVDLNKVARTGFQIGKRKSPSLHLSDLTTKPKMKLVGKTKNVGIVPFQTKSGKVDFTVFAYAMDKNAKYACYELHPVQSTQAVAIEHTLKAFLDNAKEVIYLLAPDFKIIAFNKPAELSIETIHKKQVKVGDSMLDYSEPSTHELFKQHFLQALAGKNVSLEIEVPFENYARWWNVNYRQIIDSNKQTVGVAFSAMDIHDRRMAEEEARGLATKLKATLNASNDFTYLINPQYQIVLYNEGAKLSIKQFFKSDVAVGDSILDYSPEENKPIFLERLGRAFAGETITADINFVTPFGASLWFGGRYAPVRNSNDQVIYVSLSFNDITARKANEEALRKKELQLATLADNIPKAVVFQYLEDASGNFVGSPYMSSGSQELFGFSSEQIQSGPLLGFSIVHPDDLAIMLELNRESRTKGSVYNNTHRIIVSGEIKWIHTVSIPVQLPDGYVQWDGFSIDVTDQKLAAKEMELKKFTIDHSSDSITLVTPDGSLAYVNLGAVNLLGYSFDELIKMTVPQIDDNYNEQVWPIHWQELREKKCLTFETKQRRKDGTFLDVEISANYISFEGEEFNCAYVRDITERKRAERRLIESESKYRLLANNMQDIVCLHSLEGLYEYVSPSSNQILGYEPEELLGKDPYSFFHPDDMKRIKEDSHQVVLEGNPVSEITYRFKRKQGDYVWLETQSIHVYDENNQTIAIQTSSRDVSLRKDALSKLARSQKLYESIVNSQSNFLVRTDMLGYYSFTSQRFLDHFGFKEHDVIGKHSFETIHPEDHAACEKAVMECIQTPGKITSVAFRKPNKQGEFFWTEWEFIAIQNDENEPTEIQGIGYDITDKLAYQSKLEETSVRLTVATQAAGIGIWELDIANDLLIWDDQMYTIFGVAREGLLSYDSFYNCIYPEDRAKMDQVLKQGLKEKNAVNFRIRIVRGNDKAVRHIQGFGIFNKQENREPTVIVGVNYDITDLIENEIAIEKAKSRIEELQLQSLRAAMNPHFIFNALASLQYFITQNNHESAIRFLSKFSKLVRGILNSSIVNESPLASELELIKYYVEIEQIRFENGFDFDLTVDPNIDVETTTIPALLIQPYVENAIIHGLYAKSSRGKLKLYLDFRHDFLNIVIEDNGIGRQAGAIMRERNFPRHQSHGMGITSRRIDLIRNSRPIEAVVEDLQLDGNPTGTRVTISIKL